MALGILYPRSPLRGAIPEARTKFEAEKAETKIHQEVYEGRYGRPTGEKDFGTFVEDVYKPWARENKRSFDNNEKYKPPMICESKSLKGKTFAQICIGTICVTPSERGSQRRALVRRRSRT